MHATLCATGGNMFMVAADYGFACRLVSLTIYLNDIFVFCRCMQRTRFAARGSGRRQRATRARTRSAALAARGASEPRLRQITRLRQRRRCALFTQSAKAASGQRPRARRLATRRVRGVALAGSGRKARRTPLLSKKRECASHTRFVLRVSGRGSWGPTLQIRSARTVMSARGARWVQQ